MALPFCPAQIHTSFQRSYAKQNILKELSDPKCTWSLMISFSHKPYEPCSGSMDPGYRQVSSTAGDHVLGSGHPKGPPSNYPDWTRHHCIAPCSCQAETLDTQVPPSTFPFQPWSFTPTEATTPTFIRNRNRKTPSPNEGRQCMR